MTRLIMGDDAVIAAWVAERMGRAPDESFGPCAAIGLEIAGRLAGGVVYSRYDGHSIHMTLAATSPRWATPGTIRALLHYPFDQLGCRRVTALARGRNARSIRLLEGLGFVREGVMREGFGDDDMVIYGMLREEAGKWLGKGR